MSYPKNIKNQQKSKNKMNQMNKKESLLIILKEMIRWNNRMSRLFLKNLKKRLLMSNKFNFNK